NTDQRSRDYTEIAQTYRPGHADYTFDAKYGFRDYRGGGRSSARETVARVAAGAVAKKLIREAFGGEVLAYVKQVGPLVAEVDPDAVTFDQIERLPDGEPNIVRCPDPAVAGQMVDLIQALRKDQDSIGGTAEIVARNVPAGLGEPVFDKLKADLAKALFSLPAVLGVEYGVGFRCAQMRGSEHNDEFTAAQEASTEDTAQAQRGLPGVPQVATRTNRHGGMLGGITSGMPIVLRAAVKPTSSLPREQQTVTRQGEPASIRTR